MPKKVNAADKAGETKKDAALPFCIPASMLSTIPKQKDYLTILSPIIFIIIICNTVGSMDGLKLNQICYHHNIFHKTHQFFSTFS